MSPKTPAAPGMRSLIVSSGPAPIAKLKPHPDNPNNGDTDAIKQSLLDGMYRSVCARVDGTILAGHHVYFAALELGWTELHVDFVDVDDDQALKILVKDNRLPELGAGVDLGLLYPILQHLQEVDDGLDGIGYDEQGIENIATLLDHGVWNPEDDEPDDPEHAGGTGGTAADESFWPKIRLQVPPATFDAWRALLDACPGRDDVEKLQAYLRSVALLEAP
jgi:hypothetical protein